MTTSRDSSPPERTGRSLLTGVLVGLMLVGALVVLWGWQAGPARDLLDAATPTTRPTLAVSESSEVVTAVPAEGRATATKSPRRTPPPTSPPPSPTAPPPSPTAPPTTAAAPPTTAAAPPPTTTPEATMTQVQEGPVHVTVARGADVLVDAPVGLTTLNERDELNPPSGVVGWYGPPDWATVPGQLSAHPGVLAGHTTYDGRRDVFYRLGEARAGDVVTIRYADGQEAVFRVDADALSVPKNDVTEKADAEYAWVWRLPEPGRKVSLFSCDLARGVDLTGHSFNNWVVQATRTG